MQRTALGIAILLVCSGLSASAQSDPPATPGPATASKRSSDADQKAHATGPRGTVPKAAASSYPAHDASDGVTVGAKLLSSEEARKAFHTDVNSCCVVVEVALYPRADKVSDVSLNDFVLQVKSPEDAAKPSTANVIAATLQKKAYDHRDVSVAPHGSVGYGSGSDPIYGPYVGPSATAILGVGVSGRGTQPGSTDKDRSAMETELSEKGLPEGSAAAPVAGYLYFSLPRNKKATYQLEYLLNGQKVSLPLN
jgi:hypothetical protein